LKQYILPPEYKGEKQFILSGKGFHYLTRVLRKKEGAVLSGMDKNGSRVKITIVKTGSDSCILEIEKTGAAVQKLPVITLYQCLPKGKKMDLIVRQATETGISRIIPLSSRYSIPKLENRDLLKRKERWEKIAVEAAQQSGADRIPDILPPINLKEIGRYYKKDSLALFFHQQPLENNTLHMYLSTDTESTALLIGPEGGIAEKEIDFLIDTGFHPVCFGTNVLRTETAAIYAIAAVQSIILERKAWLIQNPE